MQTKYLFSLLDCICMYTVHVYTICLFQAHTCDHFCKHQKYGKNVSDKSWYQRGYDLVELVFP